MVVVDSVIIRPSLLGLDLPQPNPRPLAHYREQAGVGVGIGEGRRGGWGLVGALSENLKEVGLARVVSGI